MRIFILEVTWLILVGFIGYDMYYKTQESAVLKEQLETLVKVNDKQADTIRQLQIDILKAIDLVNTNAAEYEKLTNKPDKKVKKITVGNLQEVKNQIREGSRNDKILIQDINNSLSDDLGRMWLKYTSSTK